MPSKSHLRRLKYVEMSLGSSITEKDVPIVEKDKPPLYEYTCASRKPKTEPITPVARPHVRSLGMMLMRRRDPNILLTRIVNVEKLTRIEVGRDVNNSNGKDAKGYLGIGCAEILRYNMISRIRFDCADVFELSSTPELSMNWVNDVP